MTRILKITLGARITFFLALLRLCVGLCKKSQTQRAVWTLQLPVSATTILFSWSWFLVYKFPFSRRQVQSSKLCWITLTFIEREANEQLLSAFRDIVVHRLWSILRTEISQLKENRFCPFNNAFLCIFFPSFTDALIVTFGKRFQQNLAVPCLCFFFKNNQ